MSASQRVLEPPPAAVNSRPSLVVYSPTTSDDSTKPDATASSGIGSKSSRENIAASLRCMFDVTLWELKSFWLRPMTYGLLLALSVIASLSFSYLVTFLSRGSAGPALRGDDDPVFKFLGFDTFLSGTGTLLIPLLTMPLIAEERRRGSWETLLTAAPNPGAVIAGKFLAGWCQWLTCLTPWFFLAVVLRFWSGETRTVAGFLPWFAGVGLDFDPGPVCGGVLGLAMIGLTFTSIGLLCSGLCRQTASAAALSFSAMLGVLFLSILPKLLGNWNCPEEWTRLANCFSCWGHLAQFSQGAISPRIIMAHISVSLLLVSLTAAVARSRDGA